MVWEALAPYVSPSDVKKRACVSKMLQKIVLLNSCFPFNRGLTSEILVTVTVIEISLGLAK